MKTITVVALCAALAAGSVEYAFAQRTSALQVKPAVVTKPLIQCTTGPADPRAPQPCESRQVIEGVRYASDLSRQEFECILSGTCGNGGHGRDNV